MATLAAVPEQYPNLAGVIVHTGSVSGPYRYLQYSTSALTVSSDPDDPYNVEGDSGANGQARIINCDGLGPGFLAIRHFWIGSSATRTTTTSPIVRAFGFYPNPTHLRDLEGDTVPQVRNVAGEWAPLYDRENSSATTITLTSTTGTEVIIDDTLFVSMSKDYFLDCTGCSKVLVLISTAPVYSGAVSVSAIQGRFISYS